MDKGRERSLSPEAEVLSVWRRGMKLFGSACERGRLGAGLSCCILQRMGENETGKIQNNRELSFFWFPCSVAVVGRRRGVRTTLYDGIFNMIYEHKRKNNNAANCVVYFHTFKSCTVHAHAW